MALSFSQFPIVGSRPSSLASPTRTLTATIFPKHALNFSKITHQPRRVKLIPKSTEEERNSSSSSSSDESSPAETPAEGSSGMDRSVKEMDKKEQAEGLMSGVAEEIREIEWPGFGKVLGTTGVVLGVIAGSSVVLLTVNAVLAEISDKVFAGKGIQDLFG